MREIKTLRAFYIIGAAIVWAAIFIASSMVLGTADFSTMLPILAGGAVFFIIIVPGGILWQGQRSNHFEP